MWGLASETNRVCNGTRTCVYDSILGNDTVLGRIGFYDLKLNSPHSTADEEGVTLADRSIC